MIKLVLPVFTQLLYRDLIGFGRRYGSKLFDTCILFFTNVVIFAYFMPQEGLSDAYGPFMLIGSIASFGLIEIVGKIAVFVADIEGDRTIAHSLTLPVRTKFIFVYTAIQWAITALLLTVPLFFLGRVILWTRWDLSTVAWFRFVFAFLTSCVFYGFFALWLSSIVGGMGGINTLWQRFIAPMWMFGAYFYSWDTAYNLNPLVGYLTLIDPMTYIMEGMRSAAFGPSGYLPYWVCQVVLWCFIVACGVHGSVRLSRKLDCV